MSELGKGIFAKKREYRKTYLREIENPHNVDKDDGIQKDIDLLEKLAIDIRHSANHCDVMGTFFDNLKAIGSLHYKYTEYISLPIDSRSYKRVNNVMKIVNFAKNIFIKDCECKYKRKVY